MLKKTLIFSAALLSSPMIYADNTCTNNWIHALIAQTPPPADNPSGYVQAIKKLAPNLKQLHLRVVAGASTSSVEQFTTLITQLRQTFPDLLIGYHPDNSKGSYDHWGCAKGDGMCVFSKSITFMNLVNSNIEGQGFDILSLEQEGYIEDFSPQGIAVMKSCLWPENAKAGVSCPQSVPFAVPGKLAIKGVKFGLVGSSYFGEEYYGPSMIDYNYPQMYNIYHHLSAQEAQSLCLTGSKCTTPDKKPFFDPSTTEGINFNNPVVVADADLKGTFKDKQVAPTIVGQEGPQGKTSYSSANPITSAQYFSFLSGLKQLNPIPYNISTSLVIPALSGESTYPEFLGGTGWSSDKLCQFNQNVISNYKALKNLGLLNADNNNLNFDSLGFSIWNFYSVLKNVCPECGL